MKLNYNFFFIFLLVLNVSVQSFYWLYFREQIQTLYYAEQVEGFWTDTIKALYPRFFTEKHRFELSFFLGKVEQILWRLAFLSALVWGAWRFRRNLFVFFENIVIERKKVIFLQIFLTLGWVYESFTWYKSLLRLAAVRDLYEPHFLLGFIPFPNEEALFYYFPLLYLFLLLSFWFRVAAIFWTLAMLLVIILTGFLYGFGKIDHTYVTWLYVSLLMPFLLQNAKQVDAWALRLMQCLVAGAYLQAGLEKLFISGWGWFSSDTLRYHLLAHPTGWGLQVAQSDWLCLTGAILMMIFQVGFASVLFFPKLKYIFLPAGIFFHLATFILMNVGGFISFWYLVYVIYLLGEKKLTLTDR